jgi:hypothetical protein
MFVAQDRANQTGSSSIVYLQTHILLEGVLAQTYPSAIFYLIVSICSDIHGVATEIGHVGLENVPLDSDQWKPARRPVRGVDSNSTSKGTDVSEESVTLNYDLVFVPTDVDDSSSLETVKVLF